MKNFTKYISTVFFALFIVSVASCSSSQKQESTGQYFDDSVITAKVKASVFDDPSLKSAEINVETFKGIVQLSGFVNSKSDINRAVDIAQGTPGVKSVKNDMRLK